MSLTYGFYNSLNHDRKYDARQIGMLFDGLITDGVYRSIGRAFAVSVNSGMILNVAQGRAWFDHTWTLNDTIMTVTLPEAHSVYTKIVAVIIRVDKANRVNSIVCKEGTAGSEPKKPTMDKTANLSEYPLAYVTIDPGVTEIRPGKIEQVIGSSECPFVTGVIQGVSIDMLIHNWKDEFDILFAQMDRQITQLVSGTLVDKSVTFAKLANDAVRLRFQNVVVNANAWVGDTTYTNYPYRASVALSGVDSTMFPDVVIDETDKGKYEFASSSDSYNGGIHLYASSIPENAITLRTVVCWR